jgi:hypothetical protein
MAMKKNHRQLALFIYLASLALSVFIFYLFIRFYPFPHRNESIRSQFLPWVANRLALYAPYKYWWSLGFIFIPLFSWALWRGLCLVFGIKLKSNRSLSYSSDPIAHFSPLEIGLATALICFLLVNFSYSAYYQFFYNYHHLNFITGPLNDVLNGKYLLIDAKTQYGFLNIFLTSFIFKAGLYFSHANVHYLSMVMGVIEYLAIYLLIRILTNSRFFAWLSIVFITTIHFYGYFPALFPSEIYVWPGNSAWRFFPVLPVFLSTLLWVKRQNKLYLYASQVLVALGFFWNLEVGIVLLLGYSAFWLAGFYLSKGSWQNRLKTIIFRLAVLLVMILSIITAYSLYTLIYAHRLPDWGQFYQYVVLFNNIGFLQRPDRAPLFGLNYLPIAAYAFIILSTVIRPYFHRGLPVKDLPFLVMIATFGYGIFNYYLNKQNLSDLATVIIPAGIIAIYLANQYHRLFTGHIKSFFGPKHTLTLLLLIGYVGLILNFFPVMRKFTVWTQKLYTDRRQNYRDIHFGTIYNYPAKNRIIALENTAYLTTPISELMTAADTIKSYVPIGQKAAVLGHFDHVLLMQAERTNIADFSYFCDNIHSQEEFEQVVRLYQNQPDYLFVDKNLFRDMAYYVSRCRDLGECTIAHIYSRVRSDFRFEKESGMIYVYKRFKSIR